MSKSARSSRAPRPEKRCGVARLPWVAILLSASFAFAILCTILGLLGGEMKPDPRPADWNRRKLDHKPKSLMSSQVRNLASLIDFHRLWNVFLVPMLIERYPGSKGIQFVRQHIRGHMESLSARWALELDTFEERTPFGKRTFSNVVATLDPSARRRLVLACHYDSKYFPADDRGRVYVGATDSAVPCSMMLELVTSLDKELLKLKERRQDLTLQLLFLDGEEALVSWSPTDSLYGSRHLAEQMARTKHPEGSSSTTLIDSVDLFVLLDLLGVSKPVFLNHFQNTARWFSRLVGIEAPQAGSAAAPPLRGDVLQRKHSLCPHRGRPRPVSAEGSPCPAPHRHPPFPWVWHTMEDTPENLDPPTIENLCKILSIFVAEYLGL
ncbi:glutaminyl-peptide cyclotransferase-like isoform X1 [Hypanus sabinus]|uniref:glutaminyl-peptide cyclotransferase-like isoform X1 n=1 Tax=Hypanus sabinus TaxID=79690 RepID=UPI0028C4A282|nr:glutaminyl-peptide cyclotransferase-like isoform X1 [Hypanus sabinus]